MFGKKPPKAEKPKTQAELIALALKKHDDSLRALEELKHTIADDKYEYARNHIESSYLRDIARATK